MVQKFCRDYVNEFFENKDAWSQEHGYHNKIVAALVATNYLKDNEKRRQLTTERNKVLQNKRW